MDEMNWMIVIVMGFNFSCLNTMITCLDFLMLVVSWHMKAATMCEFFKQEFIGGLQGLGIDSLEKFCEKIPFMCMELKDDRENTHPMKSSVRYITLRLAGQKKSLPKSSGHWLNTGASSYRLGITKQNLGTRGLNYWSLQGQKRKTSSVNRAPVQSIGDRNARSHRRRDRIARSHIVNGSGIGASEIASANTTRAPLLQSRAHRIGNRQIGDRSYPSVTLAVAPPGPPLRPPCSLKQMGREIVRQESPQKPELRSRLWYYEDGFEVLTENKGSDNIRGMMIVSPEPMKLQLEASCFEKMKNLKFLMVGFLLSSLPSNFRPQKLVALNMPQSRIILDKLFERIQSRSLTHMNFQSLRKLILQFGRKLGLPQDMKCSGVKGNVLLDLHSHRKLSHQIDFSSQISLSEFKVIRNEVTFPLDMHLTIDFGETYNINVPGKKIPKWFNHQNIGSSILIWNFHQWQGKFGDMMQGNRNHVEISCKISRWTSKSGKFAPMIARIGVHVECICSPQNSVIVQDNSQNVDDSKDTVLTPLLPPCSTSNVSHTNLGCLSGLRLDGNGFELVSSSIAHPFLKRNIPSEKSALQTLKASDWHLEGAFESRHLEELFSRYKGKVLMEYGSEICPLQASPVLSSKQTV
ncbi:hypothetical protein CMV_014460 [Castanea mollissima]|uniref:Uncharacterized protein n=1 Tax=Castanea mollissima TaxID=60419 RepID=A0A8J4QW24_9ROSI|nr:hypothetical protein CMV_014460 [Castanea mollissima]